MGGGSREITEVRSENVERLVQDDGWSLLKLRIYVYNCVCNIVYTLFLHWLSEWLIWWLTFWLMFWLIFWLMIVITPVHVVVENGWRNGVVPARLVESKPASRYGCNGWSILLGWSPKVLGVFFPYINPLGFPCQKIWKCVPDVFQMCSRCWIFGLAPFWNRQWSVFLCFSLSPNSRWFVQRWISQCCPSANGMGMDQHPSCWCRRFWIWKAPSSLSHQF